MVEPSFRLLPSGLKLLTDNEIAQVATGKDSVRRAP